MGSVRDINEIGFVPFGSNDTWWRNNRIYLSNDKNFETKTEVTSGTTLFDFKKITTYTYFLEETKSYRYIRICTNPGDQILGASKLVVKGQCEDLFGQWDIPEINGAGTYDVTLPVTHFADTKEYSMQISAYDENSVMTAFSSQRVSAENGVLSGSITIPDGTASIQAAIVNNSNEMIYANGIGRTGNVPYTKEEVSLSGGAFAEFSNADNVITVKAKGVPDDYITLQVLKNCDKTKTAEEYFSKIGENLNDNVYFSAAGISGNGISFSVPFNETGIYYLRAVRSDKKSSDSLYYRFSMVSDDKKNEFVNKIFTTDGSDWNEIINEYVDDLELLTDSNILSVAEIKADGFADALVKTREILFDNDEEKQLSHVNILINTAIEINRLYNGDFDKAEKDIQVCPELLAAIGEYASFGRFKTVLKDLLKESYTSEEMLKVLRHSAMLSYIQGGTAEEIAKALEKYGVELGIDISECKKAGVSLNRVAARIDNTKASDLYGDKLKKEYEAAIEAEKAYIKQTENENKTISSGRGGGGGGGMMPIIKPTEPPKDSNNSEQKPEDNAERIEFKDLNSFEWAKESIQALCDEGVLNGYDDGNFNPSGNVSRAEFVKMLVCGLEITVDEKKKMRFMDCSGNDWFYPYVAIAYSVGCVNGIDEYSFGTTEPITRRDIAVMLYNAIRYKGKSISMIEEKCKEDVPDYAKEAFNSMIENGIITGYEDGYFKPSDKVSRAEAAVILYRAIDFIKGGAK